MQDPYVDGGQRILFLQNKLNENILTLIFNLEGQRFFFKIYHQLKKSSNKFILTLIINLNLFMVFVKKFSSQTIKKY